MYSILYLILGVLFIGIMGALCFFCCYMSSMVDEYWDNLKKEMEKRNERR